jgi:hypothetical protein
MSNYLYNLCKFSATSEAFMKGKIPKYFKYQSTMRARILGPRFAGHNIEIFKIIQGHADGDVILGLLLTLPSLPIHPLSLKGV